MQLSSEEPSHSYLLRNAIVTAPISLSRGSLEQVTIFSSDDETKLAMLTHCEWPWYLAVMQGVMCKSLRGEHISEEAISGKYQYLQSDQP